jgi:DNA-directed RNA polymerase subunit RPC12/RpoP
MKRAGIAALVLVLLTLIPGLAAAQADSGLVLRLSRDFGYSSGTGKIQGVFSMKASGRTDLSQVDFYIDDRKIGSVTQAPFNLRFQTDEYGLGPHNLYAVGYASDGSETRSNEISVEFVSAGEGTQAGMRIAIPILAIVFGAILVSFVMMFISTGRARSEPPGTRRNYGAAGGAICPRCGRPYPRHVFAPNMVVGKLERCPYCGKWAIVPARPLDELRAAEDAELEDDEAQAPVQDAEEHLRQEIDESRFQDL